MAGDPDFATRNGVRHSLFVRGHRSFLNSVGLFTQLWCSVWASGIITSTRSDWGVAAGSEAWQGFGGNCATIVDHFTVPLDNPTKFPFFIFKIQL